MLHPTFSLIHATDFADRMEHNIIPLLKAGAVVLCDRYIYTAFARECGGRRAPRGLQLRRPAHRPAVYFRNPLRIAMKRILDGRNGVKYYEAGMDLGLSGICTKVSSFFQAQSWMNTRRWFPSST